MIKFIKRFSVFFGILTLSALMASFSVAKELPDSFCVTEGQTFSIYNELPITAESNDSVAAGASLKAGCRYTSDLKLFGVIELKSVTVNVVNQTTVIPGGQVFGIKLYTEGVMVVGMTDVDTMDGMKNPAYDAGIRKGDILLAINGQTVNTNAEVSKAFSESDGAPLNISVKRGNTGFVAKVKPAQSRSENAYKAGLWVRDSTAGIGTVTFYDPANRVFGGLGHGICDVDTGEILPLMSGLAVKADITDITKGMRGRTGELEGKLEDYSIGSLLINKQTGVYGILNSQPIGTTLPVAMSQQVHTGAATILVTLDSTGAHPYSVQIEKVSFDENSPTKNMSLRITDKVLIEKTGGIVQGMSGSPIIQENRIIGAVTHVFVNDPQRGYGIFIENMIKTAKTLDNG